MEEKKKKCDLTFNQEDFSGLEKQMQTLAEELMKSMSENEKFMGSKGPLKLGISIKVDKNGVPKIQGVKAVKKEHGNSAVSVKKSPLVSVEYLGREIVITSEYLGAKKENFELSTEKNFLKILFKTPTKKYSRIIRLKERIEPGNIKWNFNNGVIEVTLKKAKN